MGPQSHPQMGQSAQPFRSQPSGNSFPAINGGAAASQHIKQRDDWSFLRGFGDSNDDFYVLDNELRQLLDSQIATGNNNFG